MAQPKVLLDDVPLSGFHLRVTAYATGGMFCDGYILGMIGIALAVWTQQTDISAVWQGLIGASALIGIFLGALIFGPITDRVGRQTMYLADLILFIIGSVLQFFADEPWQLFLLRLLMGIAVGADYAIGAALLSEFLPRKQRGPLLASLNAVWTVGYVAAYLVGFALRGIGPDSWKWMLASSAVPAIIVLLLRLGTPESPRWLASHGRTEEANKIIADFFGPDVELGPEETYDRRPRFRDLFAGPWRKRTAFASIFWFCQVLPYFALFTFAPVVLSSLGLKNEFTGNLIVSIFQLAGAVVGVVIMNRLPRRGFTIWSFVILVISLLPLAIFPNLPVTLVVVCFAIFAFVVSGAGNLETVYPSELFPTRLRATGVGFAASMSRVGAAIGTFLLPISLEFFGTRATLAGAAVVLAVGVLVSWLWAPETRHLRLDESSAVDADAGRPTRGGRWMPTLP